MMPNPQAQARAADAPGYAAERAAAQRDAGAPSTADRELEILFPDRQVTVADPDSGEPTAVAVTELKYGQALELAPEIETLIAAFAPREGAAPALPPGSRAWLRVQEASCVRVDDHRPCTEGWLRRLGAGDGARIEMAVWLANADFFRHKIGLMTAAVRARAETEPPSPTHSWPSSEQDSDETTAK